MNPNSKDPMVRMFARMEKESDKNLENLDRSAKALKEVEKILKSWNPDK